MILQFSSALCVQPSTETVKQLPSFQIVFGGKIEWFDHSNLKAMSKTLIHEILNIWKLNPPARKLCSSALIKPNHLCH